MNSPKTVTLNGSTVDLSLNLGRVIFGKQNGSDLGDLEGPITQVFTSPEALGKVIWDVYRDRLNEIGIKTDQELYALIDDTKIREIESAFKASLGFFSWGPLMVSKIEEKLANLGEMADRMIEAIEQSGQTSGSPQGS